MSKNLTIEFKVNSKNFYPEYTVRLLLIFIFFISKLYKSSDSDSSYIIGSLFVLLNISISLLTFYGTGRRKKTILSFLKMRLKSSSEYDDFNLSKSTDFSKFHLFSIINAILFSVSIACFFGRGYIPVSLIIVTPVYYLVLWKFRFNFISSNITNIYKDGKKLNENELANFNEFLFKKNESESELYYLNDGYIYDLEEKANVYKLRVETLLIEAVFIGALTFGTFVQLTSPESITSFDSIQEKEKKLGTVKDSFLVQQKDSCKKNILKNFNFNFSTSISSSLTNKNFDKLLNIIKSKSVNYQYFKKNNEQEVVNGGFFMHWAKERQQTIFAWFYKEFDESFSKKNDSTRIGVVSIFDLNYARNNNGDLRETNQELQDRLDSLKLEVDSNRFSSLINSTNFEANIAHNYQTIKTLSHILLCNDQLELISYLDTTHIKNPCDLDDKKIIRSLQILNFHNNSNFNKFYNVTKQKWDELEYFFFISIGSIFCSVLYISVLILRFPIILSIERLFSQLKKALMWNQREETMLTYYYEYKIKKIDPDINDFDIDNRIYDQHPILKGFDDKRKLYTDRLQIQLSTCEVLSHKIQTNIQMVTFFRNLGLYTFFMVVLISTMMIDPRFTIFLALILIYTILGSSFMQEGSSFKKFWKRVSRPSSYYDSDNNLNNY